MNALIKIIGFADLIMNQVTMLYLLCKIAFFGPQIVMGSKVIVPLEIALSLYGLGFLILLVIKEKRKQP